MRFRGALAAIALVILALPTGCSAPTETVPVLEPPPPGPNIKTSGIERLPVDYVIAAVTEAVADAGAVHMTGTYREPTPLDDLGQPVTDPVNPPRTVTFDVVGTPMRLHAVVAIDDLSLEIHRDEATLLVHGTDATAVALGNPALAQGWVSCTDDDEWLQPWLKFTNAPTIVDSVLHPTGTEVIAVGPVLAGPPPILQLDVASNGRTVGTVSVLAQDDPLPVELALSDDSGTGEISLRDWNTATVPEMPDLD